MRSRFSTTDGRSRSSRREVALLAASAAALFALLILVVDGEGALAADRTVDRWVADAVPVSDDRVHVDPWVAALEVLVGLVVAVLLVLQLRRRRFRPLLFAVLAGGLAVAVTEVTKSFVSRPVIEGSGDGSFPSGTSSWVLASAAICVLLVDRRRALAAALAALVVLGVAVTVVWERWHYPTDVAGGWLVAAACLSFAWLVASERERGGGPLGEHPPDRE